MERTNNITWGSALFTVIATAVISVLITKTVARRDIADLEKVIAGMKADEEYPKDRYWLIDESHCLHKTTCTQLRYDSYNLHQVEFVKEKNFKGGSFYRYCPSCITTDDYEYVQKVLSQ